MRWRITIRGDDAGARVELRGYADLSQARLIDLSNAMKPYGLVIASPADNDYDPFAEIEEERRMLADAQLIIAELYRRLA